MGAGKGKAMRSGRALIAFFWVCTFRASMVSAAPSTVVIRDVTVVSSERSEPLPHAYVQLKGGRITAVSSRPLRGDQNIDASGKFLIPGLIDTHTHLESIPGTTAQQLAEHPDLRASYDRQVPRSYLYFGYTTVLSLGATAPPVQRWNTLTDRPDAFFCGKTPIFGGYSFTSLAADPYFLFNSDQETQLPASVNRSEHTPEAVVVRMRRDGAICVKTYYETGFGSDRNLPVPTLLLIRRLVAEARENNLPVFIHANSKRAQAFAVEAGADVIAHGMWNGHQLQNGHLAPDVQEILDKIIQRGIGYQPTARVMQGFVDLHDPEYLSNPALPRVYPPALLSWYRSDEGGWFAREDAKYGAEGYQRSARLSDVVLESLAARNARLLFGTDTPSSPTYTNPPGLNGFMEMKRWVSAGVTLKKLLSAATIDNARIMRLDREIGTIETGKRAHLLLLNANPLSTVDAYDSIQTVFLAGRPIKRESLSAAAL